MLRLIITTLLSLTTSLTALADLKRQNSYDLGLTVAPSAVPELGYEEIRIRFGVEMAVSLYRFETSKLSRLQKFTETPQATFKILRFGVAAIMNKPVLTFSPISVMLKDKLYFSPAFGFGERPYTMFSISYELIEKGSGS